MVKYLAMLRKMGKHTHPLSLSLFYHNLRKNQDGDKTFLQLPLAYLLPKE